MAYCLRCALEHESQFQSWVVARSISMRLGNEQKNVHDVVAPWDTSIPLIPLSITAVIAPRLRTPYHSLLRNLYGSDVLWHQSRLFPRNAESDDRSDLHLA